MVTAAIAAATAIASVAGGIAKTAEARRQARRQQQQLDAMKADNDAWYNRRYNEDFTQRSEIQRSLEIARNTLQRQNKAAQGVQAVMGGTDASVAAQKEAANNAYAEALAGAAANASAHKDKVESDYRTTKQALDNKQMDVDVKRSDAKMQAIDTAVQGVNAAGQAYIAGSDLGSDVDTSKTIEPTGTLDPSKIGANKTTIGIGTDMAQKMNETKNKYGFYTGKWATLFNP